MRVVLLGVAALMAATALPAAPAEARQARFAGVTVHQSSQFSGSPSFRRDGFRHDRRRHHGFDGGVLVYDREYQGDTAWRTDGFNDWWHERPQRSYPAWMTRNQNCERLYWSGGGWRC